MVLVWVAMATGAAMLELMEVGVLAVLVVVAVVEVVVEVQGVTILYLSSHSHNSVSTIHHYRANLP